MTRLPEPVDERGAILRLAGEIATLRQTVTDQMIEVLVTLRSVTEDVERLREQHEVLRAEIAALIERDERTVGAGLTTLAARLSEEVADLREVVLGELDAWFEELPAESRLALLSDRLERLAHRLDGVDGGVDADGIEAPDAVEDTAGR